MVHNCRGADFGGYDLSFVFGLGLRIGLSCIEGVLLDHRFLGLRCGGATGEIKASTSDRAVATEFSS